MSIILTVEGPNRERTGWRDLTYSLWHRTLGDDLLYIDLDGIEVCRKCRRILLLAETAYDTGRVKPTTILERLARRHADQPEAYLVHWTAKDVRLEICPQFRGTGRVTVRELETIRPTLLVPKRNALGTLTPREWGEIIRACYSKCDHVRRRCS